jgi:hypothetical protein
MTQVLSYLRTAAGNGLSSCDENAMMDWNKEPIPVRTALRIGWNLPIDVVGAGVYGGIVKRDESGSIIIGDEWPENNQAPPAHNPVHATGPYLDFSKFNPKTRGYTRIATLLQHGSPSDLEELFQGLQSDEERVKLANLVMTGGARPLHMCGMGRGGDTSEFINVLIRYGADVNAKDNYELTPMDRLASNSVAGNHVLKSHGAMRGRQLPRGVPQWDSEEFAFMGPGEE